MDRGTGHSCVCDRGRVDERVERGGGRDRDRGGGRVDGHVESGGGRDPSNAAVRCGHATPSCSTRA